MIKTTVDNESGTVQELQDILERIDIQTEQKRFVIELFTGVKLEEWHKNNAVLKRIITFNKQNVADLED